MSAFAEDGPLELKARRAFDELPTQEPIVSGPPPMTFYRGEDYSRAPKREVVVKGLMGAGELTFTHGPPKSGKSFLMTSCGLAVAEGVANWWGHRIKRPGQVLYLVQEGAGGFPMRLEAWSKTCNRPVPRNFVWSPTRLQFVIESTPAAAVEDVKRVIALVRQLEKETGEPVVLIVIDTAARVTTGADENSARDMGLFLDACALLQDLPNRPHVNVVAHDNAQGTRMRGSSARQGGGDGFIHVERQGEKRTWCLEMAKDDPETEKRGFALQSVDLDIDDDGDPVRSCVVIEAEISNSANPRQPRGKNQKLVLAALVNAVPDDTPKMEAIPAKARGIWREKWAKIAFPLLTAATEKGKREAFDDAVAGLSNEGFVHHYNGFCWLPRRASDQREAEIGGVSQNSAFPRAGIGGDCGGSFREPRYSRSPLRRDPAVEGSRQ
jgi:hypothetical protein